MMVEQQQQHPRASAPCPQAAACAPLLHLPALMADAPILRYLVNQTCVLLPLKNALAFSSRGALTSASNVLVFCTGDSFLHSNLACLGNFGLHLPRRFSLPF